jgi:hypothetical protein
MTGRPAGVEWPDDDLSAVPHGAPLLVDGELQAALRDASWWDRPDTTKHKYAHIVVASHRMAHRQGGLTFEAAACDPTRIMLFVDGTLNQAVDMPEHVRCARRACVLLFAQADQQQAELETRKPKDTR